MNEDEAFIRAIVDSPGDDLPRLVYADWLDDHDDPRGPYLRAEREAVKTGDTARLKDLATGLDSVWVARVSRPPVGVCVEASLFRRNNELTTEEPINALADTFGIIFPPEYRAFLLNYNGGWYHDEPPGAGEAGPPEYGFWGIEENDWSLSQAAERIFGRGHRNNRRSGLFPIGAGDVGRMCFLLGVGFVGAGENKLFGRVFESYRETEPWIQNGEFVEVEYWDHKAADSFPELLR